MKRKGLSYVEILLTVAIFSVGAIPLMLSLGSSYEAIVLNRDLLKVLEYNSQLVEEISAMMPTEVKRSGSSEGGYVDLDDLKDEVVTIVEARSEDPTDGNVRDGGIYQLAKWNSSAGRFDFDNLIDDEFYRKIEIDGIKGEADEGEIKTKLLITSRNQKDEEISEVTMNILLTGKPDVVVVDRDGDIGRIDILANDTQITTRDEVVPSKAQYPEDEEVTKANLIRVILEGEEKYAGKIEEVLIQVNDDSYVQMEKSEDQSSKGEHVFEKEIDMNVGSKFNFTIRKDEPYKDENVLEVKVKYELYYKENI